MIEALGPLISLLKISIGGLKQLATRKRTQGERKAKRRIIEIKIRLEDLIEESLHLIQTLKAFRQGKALPYDHFRNIVREFYSTEPAKEAKQDSQSPRDYFDNIVSEVHYVKSRTRKFMELLAGSSIYAEDDILKVFTPEARRQMHNLINVRTGLLHVLLCELEAIRWEEGSIHTFQLPSRWDHESFANDQNYLEREYLHAIGHRKFVNWVSIFELVGRYEELVAGLIECSKDLSDFISSKFKLEEIILYTTGRKS